MTANLVFSIDFPFCHTYDDLLFVLYYVLTGESRACEHLCGACQENQDISMDTIPQHAQQAG